MDTSDRQVAETGRNRELGLIPAMVMAVVATLSGAGVSFAPLYERIWGGMMLHPNCPAIGRMTYYLSRAKQLTIMEPASPHHCGL